MPDKIYKKVINTFNEDELCLILKNSFLDDEIVNFARKFGLTYQGIRIKSIPVSKLIKDLAKDFYKDYRNAETLIRCLTKNNSYYIDKIQSMEPRQTKKFIEANFSEFRSNEQMGSLMWALVSDIRPQINDLAKVIKTNLENKNIEKILTKKRKAEEEVLPVENIGKKQQKHALEEDARNLENQLKKSENDYKKLDNKYKNLQKKYEGLKTRVKKLTAERREFNHQKKNFDKEIHLLETKVQELQEEIDLHKKDEERIERLQSEIHHLERDNRKLQHEVAGLREKLLEQSQMSNPKIDIIQRQVSGLREELKTFYQAIGQREDRIAHILSDMQKSSMNVRKELERIKESTLPTSKRLGGDSLRLAAFVDVQNMFYAAKKQFNARLDYAKLLEFVVGDRRLIEAIAYVVQTPDVDQSNFVAMLQHKNYTVKMKDLRQRADGSAKGDWDMGMAIDMISLADKVHVIVLVSGDGDFVSLVNLIKAKGPRVEVIAFEHNTAIDLKEAADVFYPIDESLLLMPEEYNHNHSHHSNYTYNEDDVPELNPLDED